MSARRRLLRAGLTLVGSTLVVLTVGAQLAPGWYPAPSLSPLAPAAAPPPPAVQQRPVEREPVEIAGATGALAGWVTRPVGTSELLPGVVLVPGAGATTRDSMRAEAATLAGAGVAVISYDKRAGYGALHRDYPGLADDAVRAADVLARSPGVDARRIGLLGFSEGGWIVPLALLARLSPADGLTPAG
ncbi:MAG: alpha/beta hydrolase family protein [Propionibacteriaceae bacterium]